MNIQLILDHDELFRRILDDWIQENGNISSAAFQNTSAAFQNTSNADDMSVNLARLTTPKETISEYTHCGVASFLAGFARELDQKVLHDPILDNIAHSTVRGKKTKSIRKKLAKGSTVILSPSK